MGKRDVTKYKEQVELAIGKLARYCSDDEKDDLRQECYLELLKSKKLITGPGYAYRVARYTVLRMLSQEEPYEAGTDPILDPPQKEPFRYVSIDPLTGARTDHVESRPTEYVRNRQHRPIRQPHFQRWAFDKALDGEPEPPEAVDERTEEKLGIANPVEMLPWPDEDVIRRLYGIGIEKQTFTEVAREVEMSVNWVRRVKALALKKLRVLLGEKRCQ